MNAFYTSTDHFAVLPGLLLGIFGTAVLLLEFLLKPEPKQRRWLLAVSLGGLAFVGRALWHQQVAIDHGVAQLPGFDGAITVDRFALFFNWIFLATSAIVLLISYRYLEVEREHHGEYYGLILLAHCGMFFLAAGTDLVTLFVGLELMSLCFYILVGFLGSVRKSNEAAMKYLLLGGFSSGFLLFGFSLLYGLCGSTNLAEIAGAVRGRAAGDPMIYFALATTLAGLLFKLSAAPFHMWSPDAYEGAPTAVAAFLSVGSKAASLAILLRLLLDPFHAAQAVWQPILTAASILSLTVGNLAAITQTNLKRLLAYSSIAHVGYILLGLVAGNEAGMKGIAVYVLVYTFTNLGAFLVIVALRREGVLGEDIDSLHGLMQTHPGWAVAMLIFLLSLAGLPPTAGFLGKYFIFLSLMETGHYGLAVIGSLYVAVSLFYYFRLVRRMFVSQPANGPMLANSWGLRIALAMNGALTLGIGLYPEPFLRFATGVIVP